MHIQISRKALPIAIVLAANLSLASIDPAQANGFSTDTSQLPDASKIHRAPLKMQIIDMSPQVTDTRHPQENTVYQINVPPVPQSTTHVVQIGDPAAAGGNQAGSSNTVPILQNGLPFAGPHSNIAPHQSMANQLPKGTSTQGLTGTLARKPSVKSTPMAAQSVPMSKSLPAARPTSVAVYGQTSPSSSVSQTTSANTHVMGSLLHPQKE